MKTRFSFGLLAALLTVFLVVGLLPSWQMPSAVVAASGTPYPTGTMTPSPAPTQLPPFVAFATPRPVSESPTSIPLQPTYTSIAAETPEIIATPTLILFATMTATPNAGTATPPVPLAATLDGKPQACYKGPSLAYIQLDTFNIARIIGKDTTGKWWYLSIYKRDGIFINCWVAGDQVITGGNLSSLSVNEPELPQITQIQVDIPDRPEKDAPYTQTIACDAGLTNTSLHFVGHIFTNGPIEDVGYRWTTDAPAQFQPGHTPVKAWDAPAQVDVDLSVPSQAGTYTLSLRTTFPMEMLGELRFTVKCK
jgi:hypothetical protein